jgi:hypothetical protein
VNNVLEDEIFSATETAKILKCSVSTLARWRSEGIGPKYIKLSEHRKALVRYRSSELKAYLSKYGPGESVDPNNGITTNYKANGRLNNTDVAIETGIPWPCNEEPPWHKAVLEAFSKLKVARGLDTDESFFLDERTSQRAYNDRILASGVDCLRNRVIALCKKYNESYGRKNGRIKITTRKQDKPSGIRVWRVE